MMTLAWAQRQEELLRDCIVSPDVFQHMVDRLMCQHFSGHRISLIFSACS
jgi:hypothetical protein